MRFFRGLDRQATPAGQEQRICLGGVDDALNVHPLVGSVQVAAGGAETGALAFPEEMKRSQVRGTGGNVSVSILAG